MNQTPKIQNSNRDQYWVFHLVQSVITYLPPHVGSCSISKVPGLDNLYTSPTTSSAFHCVFQPLPHLLVILVDVAVGELLPAQLALVRLVLAVDNLVRRHLVQPLEGAVANLTSVRPFLWKKNERNGRSWARFRGGFLKNVKTKPFPPPSHLSV